ncbi:MAG TPA: heparan-alpha-glucosaminide N-acetyltransferase domain-containing protein [Polyangiales bacterium]|nr:heparan-alpha-glucosaminide N-acetyltransferase domain-containing protein [Polyangiales bacterium]
MSTKALQRLLFVDTLRGLAVLYMIQLHTSHGWLLPHVRHGDYWDATQFFGGLAAPLFLLLAGAGLGLQWSAAATSVPDTSRALARGAQLIVLGYGLRLQMWIIDGAAYARRITYPGVVLLIAGYGLAYLCTQRIARGQRCAVWQPLAAAAAIGVGLAWAFIFDNQRADGLIRVDVLQCIGASLMLLSLLGARAQRRRSRYFAALAVCVALATPWMQSWVPGPLPGAIAGYFAQWPSADGQRVIALFPLLPWLAFAAVGVMVGLAWGRVQNTAELELLLVRQIALGAVLALLTNPGWFPGRWLATPEPIAALTRLIYKVALCCAMIGPALALARAPKALRAPIVLLGRASLLVYWIHLEFAFGTVSRSLSKKLAIADWAYATIALCVCMWAIAALRNTRHATSIRGLLSRPVTG